MNESSAALERFAFEFTQRRVQQAQGVVLAAATVEPSRDQATDSTQLATPCRVFPCSCPTGARTVASCELRAVGDELCAHDGISVTVQAAAAARDVGNTKDALRLKLYGDKTLAQQLLFGQHRAQLACDLHAVHENIVLLLADGDIRERVRSSARDPCHVP